MTLKVSSGDRTFSVIAAVLLDATVGNFLLPTRDPSHIYWLDSGGMRVPFSSMCI